MAELRTCRNAGRAPTNDSNTSVLTPAVSRAPIPAPAQTPVPTEALAPTQAPASASVPGSPGRYIDKDLQKATKLALESFVKGQEHDQLQASSVSCKQPLKARFSNHIIGTQP